MKENKKSVSTGKKILAVILAVVVAIGVFGTIIGIKTTIEEKIYADSINNITTEKIKLSRKEKEFSVNNFSITLTEDFENIEEFDDQIECSAKGIEVIIFADTFEAGSKELEMSAMEYAEFIAGLFDASMRISEYNGIPLLEYKYKGENDDAVMDYKLFCYKGVEGFWMVHFIIDSQHTQFYKPYIYKWIETIEAK